MADSKNNMPVIIGAVALLLVGGGAAFYFSKNMSKESTPAAPMASQAVSVDQAASIDTAAPAAGNSNNAGEPAATEAETKEAEIAAASFGGVEVKPGNPVVATVDGRDITRVDVFRYIKMMPANVQQLPAQAVYPIALDQVINTRLVQNKAEAANLVNDPEVQQQLDMARQQIIRTVYVQRVVDKEISESDIRKKYDELVGKQPNIQEIRAAHILVDSEAKAKDLIAQIQGGANFAALAAQHSADPGNKNDGGDLGYFSKQDMVPEFSDAAFKLNKGELSSTPVKTQFGWHVVKVEDKRNRPKPSFEETKPMIQAELRREKLETMLEKWRTASNIERFDVNGDPVDEPAVAPAAGKAQPVPETAPTE